jgi:hypothetical protein
MDMRMRWMVEWEGIWSWDVMDMERGIWNELSQGRSLNLILLGGKRYICNFFLFFSIPHRSVGSLQYILASFLPFEMSF